MTEGAQKGEPARPSQLDLWPVMQLHQKNMAAMMKSWLVMTDGLTPSPPGSRNSRPRRFAICPK